MNMQSVVIAKFSARWIERLMNLSNFNWCIVDMLPILDVNFFKSTSINVTAFECWLKIVETREIYSEEEKKKAQDNIYVTELA
ncbi:hypothetical protein GLOIN_2v1786495 [Rhizophagus irregularis DAOM 181602=DAOM 197198]|uniref:Uncharacterized protein n=2 Tax=Rhizophagus irregularis TaxID=588596 RepID=A0A2P4P802_RHIID|nr:hypothetical protein GLOIN_2v1786495 [Rhizophagus irregularis DAOM 181602=DAOM 197198]POG61515.1 hypothetical protein GLOIN_2v1786495 [Rhizophagus irregularis DAOM 181602=DAOM 197198]GET64839.1 hypothetical protein GLOIN_2v1786495 [Rhizophagus irregularis DAOM 181602=DAOM 197198]|eukprot:XP_025168381.1 hypothetical protein GLOIN_2v1786495 [Rhizophagus irregularis DAOM 181602=DAOM 197198]